VAPARWLTDAEQRTWRAFLEATQRLNLQLDRELWQQAGMPLAYYQIEDSGWVQRLRCPTDKRGSFATLTDAGYAVLAAAAPAHVASVRRHLFEQLTPQQVEALGEICQAVATELATAAEACASADPPDR
jgi:hypothetical protein